MTDLQQVIHDSPVVVHPGRYAYLRAETAPPTGEHFLVCTDEHEITVVTPESRVHDCPHSAIEHWFRLIEFRVTVPFEAPGFLAAISTALASAGLNILIVSTFGRDYVLLRENDIETGLQALKQLGFGIHEAPGVHDATPE